MTEQAIITRENWGANVTALTPMAMINQAVARGDSIEVLSKLMDLQERWEANQARKAFDEAISAAKAKIGPVSRNATGHNNKRYADFSAYARVVDPIISQFGLSYRFRTAQTDRINVTCILSHRAGHYEENTLSGPPDKTGSKNDIQAIGSTLTYLQRYTLVQALGLAAGDDDDGRAVAASAAVTGDQVAQLQQAIMDAGVNLSRLMAFLEKKLSITALEEIPAARFDEVVEVVRVMGERARIAQ